MAWFIKQETFTAAMTSLSAEDRLIHRNAHRCWVEAQRNSGVAMASGFLVDDQHNPGGGGLLVSVGCAPACSVAGRGLALPACPPLLVSAGPAGLAGLALLALLALLLPDRVKKLLLRFYA